MKGWLIFAAYLGVARVVIQLGIVPFARWVVQSNRKSYPSLTYGKSDDEVWKLECGVEKLGGFMLALAWPATLAGLGVYRLMKPKPFVLDRQRRIEELEKELGL